MVKTKPDSASEMEGLVRPEAKNIPSHKDGAGVKSVSGRTPLIHDERPERKKVYRSLVSFLDLDVRNYRSNYSSPIQYFEKMNDWAARVAELNRKYGMG